MTLFLKFPLIALFALTLTSQSLAQEACDDTDMIYKVCTDQAILYKNASDSAQATGKYLLVVVGADWCPWCKALHKTIHNETFWAPLDSQLHKVEIGGTTVKGKKVESGLNVIYKIYGDNQIPSNTQFGFPFMAVVDPATGKAVIIDTSALEDNSKGHDHDRAKVTNAIEDAISQLKNN